MLLQENNRVSQRHYTSLFHCESSTCKGIYSFPFLILFSFAKIIYRMLPLLVEVLSGSLWPQLKLRVKPSGVGADAQSESGGMLSIVGGAWPRSAWRAVWRASCVWPLLLTASVDAFLHPLLLSLSHSLCEIKGQPRIFHIVWIFLNISLLQDCLTITHFLPHLPFAN